MTESSKINVSPLMPPPVAWGFLVVGFLFLIWGGWQFGFFFTIFSLTLFTPALLILDGLTQSFEVTKTQIIRRGGLSRKTVLAFDKIKRITLHQGRYNYREILVLGKAEGFSIPGLWDSFSFTLERKNSRLAAAFILEKAIKMNIPIYTTWGSGQLSEWQSWLAVHD